MKNAIRCCISCVFPCGALDVVRIVHADGHVEAIGGRVRASEIMRSHPRHVLKKPSSPSYTDQGLVTCPEITILPPDAELRRGHIYFLMPVLENTKPFPTNKKRKKKVKGGKESDTNNDLLRRRLVVSSDRYLAEILSEKASRDRGRGRVGVWRPHLESISEATSDA